MKPLIDELKSMIENLDSYTYSDDIFKEFNSYINGVDKINEIFMGSNIDIVPIVSINPNHKEIDVYTKVPVPSCKCSGYDEDTETFHYIISVINAWNGVDSLSFYSAPFNLKATTDIPKYCISFNTEDDLRIIFRYMIQSETEYRVNWIYENYRNLVNDIYKQSIYIDFINDLNKRYAVEKKKYYKTRSSIETAIDKFYEEHRYTSDSYIWQKKELKNRYKIFCKEIKDAKDEAQNQMKELLTPEFKYSKTAVGKCVVMKIGDMFLIQT